MKKYIIAISVCLLVLISCENEIPYKQNAPAPKLVVNSFINTDSLHNYVYLSLTGKNKVQEVGEAEVEVSVNGKQKEQARLLETTTYLKEKVYLISTRFQPGDVVRIDARTADGEHHAWVEETVPHPIDILNVDTNTVFYYSGMGVYKHRQLRMEVRIKDRPGERNYYRILIEQRETIYGRVQYPNSVEWKDTIVYERFTDYWPWEDVVLTDGNPATSDELESELMERVKNYYGVFEDSRFMDNEYTMKVRTSLENRWYYPWEEFSFHPQKKDMHVAVRLQSITEAEFYYLSTLNVIDSDVLDEYISDPVRLPSNVHGGTGFVGFNTEKCYVFQALKDKPIEYYDENY